MNWKRVIDRLFNSARSDKGIVEWSEIQRWPQELFSALVNTDLLIPTLPTMNVQCTGCYRSCFMEVEHQISRDRQHQRFFIVCDVCEDISTIPVSTDEVKRWQITSANIFQFAAKHFSGDKPEMPPDLTDEPQPLTTVVVKGSGIVIELDLQGQPTINMNGISYPLARFVQWDEKTISLDKSEIEQLAKSSLSKHAMQSLGAQEKRCGEWLAQLPETPRQKKKDLKTEALEKFPGLSTRGFNRMWAAHAHASWTKQGRIRKNKTPHQ